MDPGTDLWCAILETLDESVALFDGEARLSFANQSFKSAFPVLADLLEPGLPWGIFLREAVSRGVLPQHVSDRLDMFEASLDEALAGPQDIEVADRQGAYRLKLGHLPGDGFVLTRTRSLMVDTEAEALRDIEALLRKVLEACPVSLTMSRIADGQVVYRSPAAADLLGTAKSSFSHFARREDRADYVTNLLGDGHVDDMRVTCLRPDGSEFPAQLSARLIDYRGEDVIVTNIEDISRELAFQEELDRQREQLFQSEKLSALGELLAGVAHELNNPLTIIVGHADMLEEEIHDPALAQRVDKLSTAAYRCVRIVRSFLSLARQEPLKLRPIAPDALIQAALDAVAAEAKAEGVTIETKETETLPDVTADEVQMIQVLINLLTNSIHAIRDAGVGDRIVVACECDSTRLCLSVTDNGPGISNDIKTRIFDPLFTTKEAGKGTGVGLAYCLRIVAAHRGQIRLEKAASRGARFVIDLPLDPHA